MSKSRIRGARPPTQPKATPETKKLPPFSGPAAFRRILEITRGVAKAVVARIRPADAPPAVACEATAPKGVTGGREGDDLADQVLAALQKNPDGFTTRAVRSAVRARDTDVDSALRRLEVAGRAICTPGRRGALIWRAEGSWSGKMEKARPERGPAAGHGPAEPDVETDGEGES